MKATVVGKKILNFTTKEGNVIDGCTYYITYEEKNVIGVTTDKVFVSTAKLDGTLINVGDVIDIFYNKFGKVDKVEVVDDIEI